MTGPRLVVVGLDCAPPRLVFDRLRPVMPTLTRLCDEGAYGPLRSVSPPITVPAWACMTTGRTPGELGIYGFQRRLPGEARSVRVTRADLRAKAVWDRLSDAGHRVVSLFVPPGSPPPPVRGLSASCFLTPKGAPWLFPPSRRAAYEATFGPYLADVDDFRTEALETVLGQLEAMVDQHFGILGKALLEERPAFAMMVTLATDRLHHVAYHLLDEAHPRHEATHPSRARAIDLYRRVDAHLGMLRAALPDDCDLMIVSDHGARPLRGCLHLNDVLVRAGLLHFLDVPTPGAPFDVGTVDLRRTIAWAEGGYVGRIHWNDTEHAPAFDRVACLARIEAALASVRGLDGARLPIRTERPEADGRIARGVPPALLVYVADLDYRALASAGPGAEVSATNDRGPDACNHDPDGIVVLHGPSVEHRGALVGASLLDVHDTVLARFGLDAARTGRRDLFTSA